MSSFDDILSDSDREDEDDIIYKRFDLHFHICEKSLEIINNKTWKEEEE